MSQSSGFPCIHNFIRYTLLNAEQKTIQAGTDELNVDSNAVAGDFNPQLVFPETILINNQFYVLTKISICAFRKSARIEAAFLPPTVIELSTRAFDITINLKHISFGYNSQLQIINNGGLYGTALKTLTIPKSLTICGANCLGGNFNLEKIYYCGDYQFTEEDFKYTNSGLEIYLSITNKLETLNTFTIHKSDPCTIPSFQIKCTPCIKDWKIQFLVFFLIFLI